jgi:hypothetical protein
MSSIFSVALVARVELALCLPVLLPLHPSFFTPLSFLPALTLVAVVVSSSPPCKSLLRSTASTRRFAACELCYVLWLHDNYIIFIFILAVAGVVIIIIIGSIIVIVVVIAIIIIVIDLLAL